MADFNYLLFCSRKIAMASSFFVVQPFLLIARYIFLSLLSLGVTFLLLTMMYKLISTSFIEPHNDPSFQIPEISWPTKKITKLKVSKKPIILLARTKKPPSLNMF